MHLPEQIRAIAIQRVTKGFNCKSNCDGRTYSYTTPTFAFSPQGKEISEDFRLPSETQQHIGEVLKMYEGTHNYHNFTSKSYAIFSQWSKSLCSESPHVDNVPEARREERCVVAGLLSNRTSRSGGPGYSCQSVLEVATDTDMPAPAAVLCRCPCCAKMENTAFEGDADKRGMELTDVKVHNSSQSQRHQCDPELCRALHARYLQDKTKMAANPWDRLKTVFLVGIIALLALWVVLYVAVSRMGLV